MTSVFLSVRDRNTKKQRRAAISEPVWMERERREGGGREEGGREEGRGGGGERGGEGGRTGEEESSGRETRATHQPHGPAGMERG